MEHDLSAHAGLGQSSPWDSLQTLDTVLAVAQQQSVQLFGMGFVPGLAHHAAMDGFMAQASDVQGEPFMKCYPNARYPA